MPHSCTLAAYCHAVDTAGTHVVMQRMYALTKNVRSWSVHTLVCRYVCVHVARAGRVQLIRVPECVPVSIPISTDACKCVVPPRVGLSAMLSIPDCRLSFRGNAR